MKQTRKTLPVDEFSTWLHDTLLQWHTIKSRRLISSAAATLATDAVSHKWCASQASPLETHETLTHEAQQRVRASTSLPPARRSLNCYREFVQCIFQHKACGVSLVGHSSPKMWSDGSQCKFSGHPYITNVQDQQITGQGHMVKGQLDHSLT